MNGMPIGNKRNIKHHVSAKGERSQACIPFTMQGCSGGIQTCCKSSINHLVGSDNSSWWIHRAQALKVFPIVWCMHSHIALACGFFELIGWRWISCLCNRSCKWESTLTNVSKWKLIPSDGILKQRGRKIDFPRLSWSCNKASYLHIGCKLLIRAAVATRPQLELA